MEKVELKSKYSKLDNNQIVDLVYDSFLELTPLVQEVIIDEIVKRGAITDEYPGIKEIIDTYKVNKKNNELKRKALELKKAQKSDAEIKDFLLNKKLNNEQADRIIDFLPDTKETNIIFNKIVRDNVSDANNKYYSELLKLVVFLSIFIYLSFAYSYYFLVLTFFLSLVGYFVIKRNKKAFKNGRYWLDKINNEPQSFIWIKPIELITKLYVVLTIDKETMIQLYTNDGSFMLIKLNNAQEKKIFFNELKRKLPHIQFGYNDEVQTCYNKYIKHFLYVLNNKGLYNPIKNIKLN